MTMGIYGIFNKADGICLYVGQSVNIEGRWRNHQGKLRNGTHRDDFNAYFSAVCKGSLDSLDFRILVTLEERDQIVLSSLEVELFQEHRPLFYGQSPSLRNNYLVQSPEISKQIGATLKANIELSRRGFRLEGSKRIWIRRCLVCSQVFDGLSPTASYCSEACKTSAKTFSIECQDCTETFTAKSLATRWCSSCKRKQASFPVKCTVCALDFTSRVPFTKFCSVICKHAAFKERKAKEPKPERTMPCAYCDADFKPTWTGSKYCSSGCHARARNAMCNKCGVELEHYRKSLCSACAVSQWSLIDPVELELAYRTKKPAEVKLLFGFKHRDLYKALKYHGIESNQTKKLSKLKDGEPTQ